MTARILTLDSTMESIDKLSEQHPDRVNPYYAEWASCMHWAEGGAPSCLIAHVLVDHGWDAGTVIELGADPNDDPYPIQSASDLDDRFVDGRLTLGFLVDVQNYADNIEGPSRPWKDVATHAGRQIHHYQRLAESQS